MRLDRIGLGIAIFYSAVTVMLAGRDSGMAYGRLLIDYFMTIASSSVMVIAIVGALRIWRGGSLLPADPLAACRAAAMPIAIFAITMASFTLFKTTILPRAGFGFGPVIAAHEHGLLGVDAWQVTHRLFPSIWATQAIDLAYHAWFAPMALGMALCVLAPRGSVLAQRYMLAFVLVWVVEGSLMAAWLPAAGPCFYDFFQADKGRFADLTRLLADQNATLRALGMPGLAALGYQDGLYRSFAANVAAFGSGISAMPSLHNAMAILFACAAFRVSRTMGLVFSGYAVVIWIGSIHLGWHYAADGVVALVATLALWSLTGVWVRVGIGRPSLALAPAPLAESAA